jgi:hypothetical protein
MADTSGWEPVTDASGKVLGWTAAPDPGERDADWFEADRLPRVARRAAALDEAAALFSDPAFDVSQTFDAALASGLSHGDVDAAEYVALELRLIEIQGPQPGP